MQEQLKMRLQKKVCVCNDANAAALGELWQGGGRGYRDMVMVTLGTGVGGAVILNGKSARRRPWNRGRDRAYDRVPPRRLSGVPAENTGAWSSMLPQRD